MLPLRSTVNLECLLIVKQHLFCDDDFRTLRYPILLETCIAESENLVIFIRFSNKEAKKMIK